MTGLVLIGNVQLYCGDAYQITPTLPPVDAMVTDPPYEFSTSGGGKFRKARHNLEDIAASNLNKGFDFSIIDPEKHKSVVIFCHQNQVFELGLHLKGMYKRTALLSWRKTNPVPFANNHYMAECELYLHAWQQGAHPTGTIQERKRIFEYKNGQSDYDHPTVKPDAVMDKIMKNVNGKTVLDPFAGTGSTGIAALKAGKHFIGIERDPKYFGIMCARIFEYYASVPSAGVQ